MIIIVLLRLDDLNDEFMEDFANILETKTSLNTVIFASIWHAELLDTGYVSYVFM